MIIDYISEFAKFTKSKIYALINTSFELSTNMSKTSIAVKKISMTLNKMKNLISKQEIQTSETDKIVEQIKASIVGKKVSLSAIEVLVNKAEEIIKISKETAACLNEITDAVNQVNRAINQANDMYMENNSNLDALKKEMENFVDTSNSGGYKNKKVLLIDDDEFFRTTTTTLLKDDFDVITAGSGSEALALFHQGLVPDAILLDLVMPDMDGWDTFERIKAIGGLHDVPIAFFTSSFEIDTIKKAFDVGVDEYISKPVNKEELMKTLNKMLEKQAK